MEKNQNEYHRALLKAAMPLADTVIEEAYKNQIEIVQKEYNRISNLPGVSSVSFVNITPNIGEGLFRRNGFVIGLNEIPVGEESKPLFDAGIYTKEQNDIYSSVGVCEKPLGYTFGFSVKFPKGKNSIVIDSKKGESVPINSENLENKLKEQGLNPSSVKKAQTKYNYEKLEKELIYQILFNYKISKEKIDAFRNLHTKDPKETIKDDFRNGIRKPLEKAIDCIVNLELK